MILTHHFIEGNVRKINVSELLLAHFVTDHFARIHI